MESLKRIEPLWLLLLVVGGLNWACVALFDENVLSNIFGGGTLTDVVYCILGFAALMMLPALLERMHVPGGMHRPHAPSAS
jgi:uncharacterized membrane protein YuzA (DUF378 family)